MTSTQKSNIDILVTIYYDRVKNQKENFRKFLLNSGINFRKNTTDKNHSVSNYLSNIDRFSKMVAKKSNVKDFDLLCFSGKNSDIDKIFEFGKRFFEDKQGFIKDCRSAIRQYKKFNSHLKNNK